MHSSFTDQSQCTVSGCANKTDRWQAFSSTSCVPPPITVQIYGEICQDAVLHPAVHSDPVSPVLWYRLTFCNCTPDDMTDEPNWGANKGASEQYHLAYHAMWYHHSIKFPLCPIGSIERCDSTDPALLLKPLFKDSMNPATITAIYILLLFHF